MPGFGYHTNHGTQRFVCDGPVILWDAIIYGFAFETGTVEYEPPSCLEPICAFRYNADGRAEKSIRKPFQRADPVAAQLFLNYLGDYRRVEVSRLVVVPTYPYIEGPFVIYFGFLSCNAAKYFDEIAVGIQSKRTTNAGEIK